MRWFTKGSVEKTAVSADTTVREKIRMNSDPNPAGCWIWRGNPTDRYGTTTVRGHKDGAHRHAYREWHGEIPPGYHVRHKCHVQKCVNPDHLTVGTVQDNANDKVQAGRQTRGTAHRHAKMTDDTVRALRAETGKSQRQLAREYGLSQATVWAILNYKAWTHVH